MNQLSNIQETNEIKLLEDFITNNHELELLESIIDKFNIFRSLGIINTEIRHSHFLSWLLDPNETHGLDAYFLKIFLKEIAANNKTFLSGYNIFQINAWNLDNILESIKHLGDIDVLAVSDKLRKVFAIECKNTNTSRTPYEMNLELMSFKDKWIPKVDKRKQWLIENKPLLNKPIKADVSDFDFEYLFFTEVVIPIGFLKEHQIYYRFIPYFALERSIEETIFFSLH